jgi:hypothetical protein
MKLPYCKKIDDLHAIEIMSIVLFDAGFNDLCLAWNAAEDAIIQAVV